MPRQGATILLLSLLALLAPGASQSKAATPDLMMVWGVNDYQLFSGQAETALLEHLAYYSCQTSQLDQRNPAFSGPSQRFSSLDAALATGGDQVWFFAGEPYLYFNELSAADTANLGAHLREGAVVGCSGDGLGLVDWLDLYQEDQSLDLTQEQEEDHLFFANARWDGQREDLLYDLQDGITWGQAWESVLDWSANQLAAGEEFSFVGQAQTNALATVQATEGLSPWETVGTTQSFGAELSGGTVWMGLSAAKLSTDSQTSDWFYVQLHTVSSIDRDKYSYDYSKYLGFVSFLPRVNQVGWYTDYVLPSGTVSANATIWDFTPETDLENRSVTKSIGGELGVEISQSAKAAGKVSASQSISYDLKDVKVYNYCSPQKGRLEWKYAPRGAEVGVFKAEEPAMVARSTASFKTAFIAQVTKGASFSVQLSPKARQVNYSKEFGLPGSASFWSASEWTYQRPYTFTIR